eukprot:1627384-Pyramimonas_sp.AAC.1
MKSQDSRRAVARHTRSEEASGRRHEGRRQLTPVVNVRARRCQPSIACGVEARRRRSQDSLPEGVH